MKMLKNLYALLVVMLCSCSIFVAGTSEEENTMATAPALENVNLSQTSEVSSSSQRTDAGLPPSSTSNKGGPQTLISATSGKSDVVVTPVDTFDTMDISKITSSATVMPVISSSNSSGIALSSATGVPMEISGSSQTGYPVGDPDVVPTDNVCDDNVVKHYEDVADTLFNARVAKLVEGGKNETEAKEQVLLEIRTIFMIESTELKFQKTMPESAIKIFLGYVMEGMDAADRASFVEEFVSEGTGNLMDFCWLNRISNEEMRYLDSRFTSGACYAQDSENVLVPEVLWEVWIYCEEHS